MLFYFFFKFIMILKIKISQSFVFLLGRKFNYNNFKWVRNFKSFINFYSSTIRLFHHFFIPSSPPCYFKDNIVNLSD